MRQAWGVGLVMPAAMLVITGCATKDWVREQLGQKETEIGARIATVDTRVGTEAQRITAVEDRVTQETKQTTERIEGMGYRVTTLEGSVTEVGAAAKGARERADAAFTRADTAFTRADEVDGRLTRLWSKRNARNLVDTVHVQFAFNRADLTDAAQTALLSVVKELKDNPNLTIELEGYTDPKGPKDYNVQLSQRRVESVRRYLIERGAELPRIHAVGLGPINGKGNGETAAQQRRVTVKLMVAAE